MGRPQRASQAVIAIWTTLALSATSTLANKLLGDIEMGEFISTLVIYSLLCILPYKIGMGSNAARFIYAVLIAISTLFLIGGMGVGMPKLDLLLSIILVPVEIFILFRLFQKEASSCFLEMKAESK
jgi:hypothetical protein